MNSRVHEAWAQGRPARGAFLFTRLDPVVIESIAHLYDYVVVDLQHGLWDLHMMINAIRALQPGRAMAIVRVPSLDKGLIGRALDAGAMGIIVPGVESAEQVRAAVTACRYVPGGERSYGPIGAMVRYGLDYVDTANDRVLVIPMIETRTGLERADEICAVPGVDAIYVGPFDLSISLGGQPTKAAVEALAPTLERVAKVAKKHGVVAGIHGTVQPCETYHEMGFDLITVVTDFDILTYGFRRAAGVEEGETGY
ncbi:HpcH/HpaI aldolase family protein [Granulicoccus sp. GXG6511]|uniref:HpcH/HpaI aldolase family protein n=1 Tax=Granulicoccus sp. GXG6511 TaxID=3381351 RepID=UPI003D7EE189